MNVLELPPLWRTRALVISDVVFERSWYTVDELSVAGSFHLQKRREEWLASRYAAKKLAMDRGLCSDPAQFHVDAHPIHRSISHSAPYAAAAIEDRPVGIDVQVIRSISEKAAHLFLTEEETESMRSLQLADRMLHFWCAKEAAWKMGRGEAGTLKRVPIRMEHVSKQGLLFDVVETVRIGNVIVALTR
jgi:phosphopantetheinyl transferase